MCEIFSCHNLQISSELELFNAAVDWIKYKPKERSKHMNKLLKLIRLPLLTDEILTDIVKEHKLCKDCTNCKCTIYRAMKSKNNCADKTSNIQFQNRYYSSQFETQVMLVGALLEIYELTAILYTFDGTNLIKSKAISQISEKRERNDCKTAAIGSKVYGFCDESCGLKTSCEVYCRKTDTWSLVAPFPGSCIEYSCVCAFMNKIYVFGDLCGSNRVYDPSQNDWKKISDCNIKRNEATCTVFQDYCVLVGG